MNLYTYVSNNPLYYIDPTGHKQLVYSDNAEGIESYKRPVKIGYVYVIQGPYQGKIWKYVGSTAQELLKRMGKHKWAAIITAKTSTVTTYEVKAVLNARESGRGTLRSAKNEALRSAEQIVKNVEDGKNEKLLNERDATTKENLPIYQKRHNVEIDLNSPKLSLKGGVTVKAFNGLALWDLFKMYRDAKISQYTFAPYLLEDEGGIFTIGEGKNGWFSSYKYWKTYQSGAKAREKEYIGKEDFKFWKREAEALWGRIDFLGDFVPGLLNPELPVDGMY